MDYGHIALIGTTGIGFLFAVGKHWRASVEAGRTATWRERAGNAAVTIEAKNKRITMLEAELLDHRARAEDIRSRALNASRVSREKRAGRTAAQRIKQGIEQAEATARTRASLAATPIPPREAVVADIRASRAARNSGADVAAKTG